MFWHPSSNSWNKIEGNNSIAISSEVYYPNCRDIMIHRDELLTRISLMFLSNYSGIAFSFSGIMMSKVELPSRIPAEKPLKWIVSGSASAATPTAWNKEMLLMASKFWNPNKMKVAGDTQNITFFTQSESIWKLWEGTPANSSSWRAFSPNQLQQIKH